MLVKSQSRKDDSFGQFISYMANDAKRVGRPITRNLIADPEDLEDVERAFQDNAKHLKPRKNGIYMYTEIMSLSPEDRAVYRPEMLADLADKYLLLRVPDAVAFGMIHDNTGNPHCHLLISSNNYGTSKKCRIDKEAFEGIKRQLEAYQQHKYPELKASLVFGKDAHKKDNPLEVATDKLHLRGLVAEAFLLSYTEEEFYQQVCDQGERIYSRAGRPTGIIRDKKRYRFSKLGVRISKARGLWDQIERRCQELDRAKAHATEREIKNWGYAEQVSEILDLTGLPPKVYERMADLIRIRWSDKENNPIRSVGS